MHHCHRCAEYGLSFQREYRPEEFLEGSADSPVWIIGLNPAVEPLPERNALRAVFSPDQPIHSYFRDFAVVSPRLFERLGKPGGVAHTDLVRCSSKSWPPEGVGSAGRSRIIGNCTPYLLDLIRSHPPRLIICNGAEVSAAMQRYLPPEGELPKHATWYVASMEGHEIFVVLSGFIGRIDHFAKRRLGREIDDLLDQLGVWT